MSALITEKTILITGGAGFIGSHLAQRLLADGNRVIVVDNLVTGSFKNIEHLEANDNFLFIEHNVSEYFSVAEKLDWVMHLASPASPVDFEKLAIPILKVGSLGTHNALGLAKEKNAKFFLASTSEVYGDPLVHPQPESYFGNVNPIGPRGVYDESKRFAESITMAYHHKHGIDTRIVRIFNTYGPRMRVDDGRVVCSLLCQALNNQDLTICGDGSQTRSFQYIDDLIEGFIRLMSANYNGPVNIGNPNEFTICQLAQKIIDITGAKSQLKFIEMQQDDPKRRKPDISLAKELLSWEPLVQLEDGLKRSLEYFSNFVA
jgi:dTDP-glucose 4,6-dehydratase